MPRIEMAAVVRRKFVTMREGIRMPKVNSQPLLYKQKVPVVNDAHPPAALPLVLALKGPQSAMQVLRLGTVRLGVDLVQAMQESARLAEEFRCGAAGLALAGTRPRCHPKRKCGKSSCPLEPLLQDRQSREVRAPARVDLVNDP